MGSATADALAPALAETFIIIALGYILARTKVLGSATCHHISLFITYIALPALVFQAIATLDLSSCMHNHKEELVYKTPPLVILTPLSRVYTQ